MTKPRILVAPHSFKGSVGAQQAAETIARGLQKVLDADVQIVPLADGGKVREIF